MFTEFKKFITGGNVIEFAVAFIMAGAIGAVAKGFVTHIVMPFVGIFTGGISFADKKQILSEAVIDPSGISKDRSLTASKLPKFLLS